MKKVIMGSIVLGVALSSAGAFDYKFSGEVGSWSKFGLNNQAVNPDLNQYPTESIMTLTAGAKVDFDIVSNVKAAIGGFAGSAIYDSIRKNPSDGTRPDLRTLPIVSDRQEYIVGSLAKNGQPNTYLINHAYISYDNGTYGVKVGRYESGNVGYYFSGFNQGAEAYAKFGDIKVWGFFSDARAFAYSSWLYDFYKVNGTRKGLLGGGVEFNHNGLKLGAFMYGKNTYYIAPGVIAGFNTTLNVGGINLDSETKVVGLFPQANLHRVGGGDNATNWGAVDRSSYSLYLEQKFKYSTYNFGGGIYYNSGNANGQIGTFGNPLMLDFWTGSMYDVGNAISDMVGKNAFTPFVFGGTSYGKLGITAILRHTNSLRSLEQSAGILLDYKLRDDISIGGKVEYLNDITKAGYVVGTPGFVGATERRSDDRSHAFFYVQHNF